MRRRSGAETARPSSSSRPDAGQVSSIETASGIAARVSSDAGVLGREQLRKGFGSLGEIVDATIALIEGDPATEVILQGAGDGRQHPGYVWTAMNAANAIPAVVEAAAGVLTNFDLGLLAPKGLFR